jgi:dephospho-CoA kinase
MNTLAPEHHRTVVGILGEGGTGKDTVARIFAARGYTHVSSSDLVRHEIAARGLTTSRKLQTEVANELRVSRGLGYWVELSLAQATIRTSKVAISGIYSPGEGAYLTTVHKGKLVSVQKGVEQTADVQFRRTQARAAGDRDAMTYEEFLEARQRENSGELPHETNLAVLHHMAHFTIYNSADFDSLARQTEAVIDELEKEQS